MDGSTQFTVYWALSIKQSTFFTQTSFHVPAKQPAKHTPSFSAGCSHSHRCPSDGTSCPRRQPCTTESLSSCSGFRWKQQQTSRVLAANTLETICQLSQFTTHWGHFIVRFGKQQVLIYPPASRIFQYYEKPFRKLDDMKLCYPYLSKMSIGISKSFSIYNSFLLTFHHKLAFIHPDTHLHSFLWLWSLPDFHAEWIKQWNFLSRTTPWNERQKKVKLMQAL